MIIKQSAAYKFLSVPTLSYFAMITVPLQANGTLPYYLINRWYQLGWLKADRRVNGDLSDCHYLEA